MPDRPKSPMQRSISIGELQLGSELARKLGVARDTKAEVTIAGESFQVQRVNRASGTWQDSAAFIDLKSAQNLFQLPERISRIEAIECTSEQCEASGLQSSVILNNEIAKITDEASFLRKEGMAEARLSVRSVSRENFLILQNVLWVFLALTLLGLAMLNSLGRKPEIGVLQAVGYGRWRVASLFLVRIDVAVCDWGCGGDLCRHGGVDGASKSLVCYDRPKSFARLACSGDHRGRCVYSGGLGELCASLVSSRRGPSAFNREGFLMDKVSPLCSG